MKNHNYKSSISPRNIHGDGREGGGIKYGGEEG